MKDTYIEQVIKEFDDKFGSIHKDRPMPSGLETSANIKTFLSQSLEAQKASKAKDKGNSNKNSKKREDFIGWCIRWKKHKDISKKLPRC